MMEWLGLILITTAGLFFSRRRLLSYLRYYQQQEYDSGRYLHWIFEQRAFDRRGSVVALAAFGASALLNFSFSVAVAGSALLGIVAACEEDPRKKGKITLKMTERATRIYRVAWIFAAILESIALLVCAQTYGTKGFWLLQIILFQVLPLLLIAANVTLQWGETRRQAAFIAEAKQILAKVQPYVIGITGSYGKTSTKDALGQMLQITLGPTFWPSKGVNTPMGITQEIRMRLPRGMRYAVIEMGAYGIGSIKRLCKLTPPQVGIITGIGTAHLERFGSQETIYQAKAELAQAIPAEGILVCNGDNPGARRMALEFRKRTTLLYGFDNQYKDLDCWVSSWITTTEGTTFTLHWKGKTYEGKTPLFGKAALSNAIGAFALSCTLGSNPEYAMAVIRNLEPVDNRLQVMKDRDVTYLRDAYNSNPVGFATALEVMKDLPGKRRIVMTPGFIELGPQQGNENERIGRMAAGICDVAIVVGKTNRLSLKKGLIEGGLSNERLHLCDTRDSAFAQLATLRKEGDIILIENDLPDLYESSTRF